jgi:hypothetical protein
MEFWHIFVVNVVHVYMQEIFIIKCKGDEECVRFTS